MRWITSLLIVLAMMAGAASGMASGTAHSAAPVAVAAQAVPGPAPEIACEGCREIVSDCLAPACEMPGVFGGRARAGAEPAARIGGRMAGDTRASGLASPPSPPPPRG